MTFSKYACWKPEMIRKVMDVEATQPEEHIFLATHSPVKMHFQSIEEAQRNATYSEEKFLQTFLSTSDFIFVSVLGTSGTGKSHLIRWLYTRIRSIRKAPHYRVLLIPKVGTNLRDIIELILADVEGPEFDEYRNRLRQAANTLTEAEAREQLLANLAIAVGSSGRHDASNLSDEQDYLIKSLPALLHDPFFREHWLKKEGIIHRLVIHILGRRESVEIVEERRQFSLEDLPLNVLNITKASAQAQDFYSFLIGNDEIQKATVAWLNIHLDEAIAKVLNLGREDLQRLMLDVRRALARKDVELILLIEDFAKLQGIDREVLEAVLARSQQGQGEPLCAMRTALACTTGYFQGLVDTVRTRTDFIVNLDVETVGEQSLVTPADVQQLAARYLNAVRLQDPDIRDWLTNVDEETGEPIKAIPNACIDCEHQSSCHAGFGAVDGMGLYPFNATALKIMRERTNQGVFNPRTLIKDVLRYTLEYHRSDLEKGQFPSTLLLDHFGGSKLNAILVKDIKTEDPVNADRREALLNFWSDSPELCNLPSEVHTAFDLPNVPSRSVLPSPPPDPNPPPLPPLPPPLEIDSYIRDLDNWRNGTQLPPGVATELRPKLFIAIDSYIDWDAELILRSHVVNRLFKQRNITFSNAATSVLVKDIELRLPLSSEDLGDTVIALQALLLYNHHQHWNFKDGAKYFRVYARKLEDWSQYVLQSVPKCSTKSGVDGDPVPSVVELLAIAGRMAGGTTTSLEDLVNAAFTDLEKVDVSNRAGTWQKLFNSLKKHQPKLREVLESRIPCTKGGRSVLQVIDAVQLVGPLKSVAATWKPQVDISDISSDSPFDAISKARKEVDELLEQAVWDERDRHLAIYQRVLEELGEDFSQAEVVKGLLQTVERVTEVGVFRGTNRDDLKKVMEEFKGARLKDYLSKLQKLQDMNEIATLLPLLSSLPERPVEVITKFLDYARKFVDKSQEAVQSNLADLRTAEGGELEASYVAIERSLLELQQLASEIKGEAACS
ncbi:hypothetical protein C7293_00210 [filamentous cyanobacterium CCT1]|nr:hypothetical protein C7293_00210 [filamentous cyanobacterium CCT1]PSN81464.1 hypothetical protein C8B47_01150 [filamentous cyanobacterium CCP4]